MRVVIAGAGIIGRGLARRLIAGKHDVTMIELDRQICERVYSQLGVTTINGSATSISVLEEAELHRAECAAAVMLRDADNLCFAILAKSMGVPRIIARMREPNYEEAYKLAGVTRVLNIVDLYLNQFTWEIEEPAMREVTSFGEGKASIVFVKVPDDSPAAERTVAQIAGESAFPAECVVAGIFRPGSGEFIVPRGDVTVHAEDRVYLAASNEEIRKAVRYLGGR